MKLVHDETDMVIYLFEKDCRGRRRVQDVVQADISLPERIRRLRPSSPERTIRGRER